MKTNLLLILSLFVAAGCDSRKEMREQWPIGTARILTAETGERYIVSHHMGDTYSVTPVKP